MSTVLQLVQDAFSAEAIFWRGRPAELKDTQLRQLAPMDAGPPSQGEPVFRVILAVPGAVTRTQTLESILEGLEAMEVHRQLMQARRNDEDEYADALARDQAAAARALAAQQAAPPPAPMSPQPTVQRLETRPPADERHLAAAEQFLSEAPSFANAEGRDDAVRLVLKLPSGERVERTFNAQDGRIASLEAEANLLTGKDKKKERAAKGKEVAELKGEQQYVDACKIVKGLEPKFGYFVTKAAEAPKAVVEKAAEVDEVKPDKAKKDTKKETKKESAGLSPAETKELETLKQGIVERKAILKEQGMSGGQQNKDEEVVKMVARMNELKEKQDPGSTKKEKDAKKDSKKKTPLSAEEQKEFAQLQNQVEIYKAKLRSEFGYSNKDMKADPDLQDMEARLAAFEKRS
eukprot:s2711_g9.t3